MDSFKLFIGCDGTNISFNSKNSINENANVNNTFEFSNNDFIDKEKCSIVDKNIKDSEEVITISNNGTKIGDDSNKIVTINSTRTSISNSELVTTFNTNSSTIKDSVNVFNFGKGNNLDSVKDCIVIGNNLNSHDSKYFLAIGNNIVSNGDSQILVGDFTDISTKDIIIGFANKENVLYTNRNNEDIHVSKDIVIDTNIHNDKTNPLDGSLNVILDKNFKSGKLGNKSKNIILGDKNSLDDSNNNIVVGTENSITNVGESIVGGYNNEVETNTDNIVFGEDNYFSSFGNSLILGNNNKGQYFDYSIIAGSNNIANSHNGCVEIGSNNTIQNCTNCLVAGERNELNTSNTLVIGERFSKSRVNIYFGDSYIISNKDAYLILGQDYIKIDKIDKESYEKYIEDCFNFADYYSKFKYSILSIDNNTNIECPNGQVYFKMAKDGFCQLVYNSRHVISFKLEFIGDKLTLYSTNYVYNPDIHYYIKDNTIYVRVTNSYIKESSNCELIQSGDYYNGTYTEMEPLYLGLSIMDIVSQNLNTYNLYMKQYSFENGSTNVLIVNAVNLITDNYYIINNTTFNTIKTNTDWYKIYVNYTRVSESLINKDSTNFIYEKLKSVYGIDKYNGSQESNISVSLSNKFYSSELVNVQYKTNCNSDAVQTLPYLRFKRDGKIYNFYDLCQMNFATTREKNGNMVTLKSEVNVDNVKGYFNGTNRFGTLTSRFFDDCNNYGQKPKMYDSILRFHKSVNDTSKHADFIVNHNLSSITKWGLMCNVSFEPPRYIYGSKSQSFDQEDLNCMTTYIETKENDMVNGLKVCTNGVDIPVLRPNSDVLSDYGIETVVGNEYRWGKYTQSYNVGDRPKFYIPFMNVRTKGKSTLNIRNFYDCVDKVSNSLDELYEVSMNFEPKSRYLNVVKRLNEFSFPLSLVIKYNKVTNDSCNCYIKTTKGVNAGYESLPLFYGEMSIYGDDNLLYVDYNGGNIRGVTTRINQNSLIGQNTNNMKYFNLVGEDMISKESTNTRIVFTYMLKHISDVK